MFALFTEAIGFYVLINGDLQVIVPDDFDYEDGLSTLPCEFGGLKVSFIRQSLYPTGDYNPDNTSTSTPTIQQPSGPRAGARATAAVPSASIAMGTAVVEDSTATSSFKRNLGSSVRATIRDIRLKNRYEGKVGMLVAETGVHGKVYATVPTHIFTEAVSASKTIPLENANWIHAAGAQMARSSTDVSHLSHPGNISPDLCGMANTLSYGKARRLVQSL